jgi:murein DD-endopeptidase MepM/ murein hydrolase activator NlpD
MSDDNRIQTILVLPYSGKALQFSFEKKLIYYIGGGVAVLILGSILGILGIINAGSESARIASMKSDYEKLKQENETYKNSYSKLKGQISYINDMSKELARQAKMEQGPDVDKLVGAGGPETVTSLDKAAGQLENNLRTISSTLRTEQLKMATVPDGVPVEGYITDDFGSRRNPMGAGHEFHPGLDIVAEFGTPVKATADGIIVHASPMGGYGNLVAIYHSNGIVTRYGHLSKITVEAGQRVKRGDQIGNVGSTGRSTGPHCHYEVRENDQTVDPQKYIRQPNS